MKPSWHRPRDAHGRFLPTTDSSTAVAASPTKKTKKKKSKKKNYKEKASKPEDILPTTTPTELQKTNISVLLDNSASMRGLTTDVRNIGMTLLDTARAKTDEHHQIRMSYHQFKLTYGPVVNGDDALETFIEAGDVKNISRSRISTYNPSTNTPLRAALYRMIEKIKESSKADESQLIYVLTDGLDNGSGANYSPHALQTLIKNCEEKGNWTFVILCPASMTDQVQKNGFPEGNVRAWEATKAGAADVADVSTRGLNHYLGLRSRGVTATKKFFTEVKSEAEIIKALKDETSDYYSWSVDTTKGKQIREGVEYDGSIKSFVADVKGKSFDVGKGYYQLTKRERVQARKNILLRHKKTGKIYGGPRAKEMIGLPAISDEMTINPGNNGWFEIYIQSTSDNRILARGSRLLYKKN